MRMIMVIVERYEIEDSEFFICHSVRWRNDENAAMSCQCLPNSVT